MERVCETCIAMSLICLDFLRQGCRGGEDVDGVDGAGELAGEEFSLSLSGRENMVLTEGMRRF